MGHEPFDHMGGNPPTEYREFPIPVNITHAYDMIMPSGKENAALDGYCSKHDDRQEFMLAIDTVLAGWIFLSSSIADNVLAVF